eukprot:1094126-Rhodomonas_salina.4
MWCASCLHRQRVWFAPFAAATDEHTAATDGDDGFCGRRVRAHCRGHWRAGLRAVDRTETRQVPRALSACAGSDGPLKRLRQVLRERAAARDA